MKRLVFLMAGLVAAVMLAGEYVTRPLAGGGLALTNGQDNSRWDVTGVLIRFGQSPTGVVEIARESAGSRFVLATAPAGATSVWWWAWQPLPFRRGDALTVGGGGGTGVVQVLR